MQHSNKNTRILQDPVLAQTLLSLLEHTGIVFILVWPTSWTPAVGGLIVCMCFGRHVAILLGA